MEEKIKSLRVAADIHKKVRKMVKDDIKPGAKILDICEKIENNVRLLSKYDTEKPLLQGIGFPCGFSVNNCAAHWTPVTSNEKRRIKKGDVCKIDFGVHVNGYIIDSAWTVAFDEKYNNLLNATRDATDMGLKLAGCDARISEISANIEEVINSYDIVLNHKRYKIKPVRSLCGHEIEKYKIHHKKAIPIIKMDNYHEKMKEGELYAIETFASTGTGNVIERGDCSHYMVDYKNEKKKNFQNMNSDEKLLLTTLYKKRSTLPFCPRWLKSYGINNYSSNLNNLVKRNIINTYPPLYDVKGSYISQFEHTILIYNDKTEVLSRSDDY
jgi:methionyl aminopeptidase